MKCLGLAKSLYVLMLVGTMAVSASAAPMVVNGDFESDTEGFGVWPGYTGNGNPDNISGWNGDAGRGVNPISADHESPAPFRDNGANDSHVAFVQGTAFIEQEISGFEVGGEYVLSFDYNSRNCCGDMPIATIMLDDETLVTTDGGVVPVGDANPWYHADIPFTAGESDITLRFASMSAAGGDSTLLLDNISINVVPEPSAIVLMCFGLLVAAGKSRRQHL